MDLIRRTKEQIQEALERQGSEFSPHKLSEAECDLRLRQSFVGVQYEPLAEWPKRSADIKTKLPLFYAMLKKRHGFEWPEQGDTFGLSRLNYDFYGAPEDSDRAMEASPVGPGNFYVLLNQELRQANLLPWTPKAFLVTWHDASERRRIREEVIEEKVRPKKVEPLPGGRKRTTKTEQVEIIQDAIGCSSTRAYIVVRQGTAVHEQRVALARAFPDDPKRNKPTLWEPQLRARAWGRQSSKSFRRYLLQSGRDFEPAPLGDIVTTLQAMAKDGWLPDNFHSFDEVIASLEKAGATLPVADAYRAWQDFLKWCERR